jgi:hypothetical protein
MWNEVIFLMAWYFWTFSRKFRENFCFREDQYFCEARQEQMRTAALKNAGFAKVTGIFAKMVKDIFVLTLPVPHPVNKRNCHGTLVIDREAQEARLVVIMMKAWYLLVTASVRPNAQKWA